MSNNEVENGRLIPHLFRTEYGKIVAVLCARFGFEQIEIAEDITSDTFLTAMQAWGLGGVPQNPVAWLYNVAKNKAKNHLHRNAIFNAKVTPVLENGSSAGYDEEIDLSPQNISDSQLRMMFAVCHPSIPPEAQIGLSLRILCGFGIDEIAAAFLTNKEVINKRLFRAKDKLRAQKIKIDFPIAHEMDDRLSQVLTTIYLLFNEGYYATGKNRPVRKEMCLEAMRMCTMLVENKATNKPQANALLALMCFHASRFDARINKGGELVLYEDQDPGCWNAGLISKGIFFLHASASGNEISTYHLEAEIAYWNTRKGDAIEKWAHILQCYNSLLQIAYSPVAALNRTFALSKVTGKPTAIIAAEKLNQTGNHFYDVLLGELYTDVDNEKAALHFKHSLSTAKITQEQQVIQNKIDKLSI